MRHMTGASPGRFSARRQLDNTSISQRTAREKNFVEIIFRIIDTYYCYCNRILLNIPVYLTVATNGSPAPGVLLALARCTACYLRSTATQVLHSCGITFLDSLQGGAG